MFKFLLYLPCIFFKNYTKIFRKNFPLLIPQLQGPIYCEKKSFSRNLTTWRTISQPAQFVLTATIKSKSTFPNMKKNHLPNVLHFNQNSTKLTDCLSNITVCNQFVVPNTTQNPYAISPKFLRTFQSVN